jgi:hypothetical protein
MTLRIVERSPSEPAKGSNAPTFLSRVRFQLLKWFFTAFPMAPLPDPKQPMPPLAKSGALREGALLREDIDAVSGKRIA